VSRMTSKRSPGGCTPRFCPKADSRLRSRCSLAVRPSRLSSNSRSTNGLPECAEVAAYYVLAEALTNAAKHAQATEVRWSCEVDGENLCLRDSRRRSRRRRLSPRVVTFGLKDRVEAVGGQLVILRHRRARHVTLGDDPVGRLTPDREPSSVVSCKNVVHAAQRFSIANCTQQWMAPTGGPPPATAVKATATVKSVAAVATEQRPSSTIGLEIHRPSGVVDLHVCRGIRTRFIPKRSGRRTAA